MIISEVYIWGAVLTACLVGISVMVMPTLYAGMLLGGIPVFKGLIVILLLISASFVANVLTGIIALSMIRKGAQHHMNSVV